MADISLNRATQDIIIQGGDLVFTSDTDFVETMRQRIRAVLLTFLGEWFLDSKENPTVGIPYFQSLLENKVPTLDLADSIFRVALLNIPDVVTVEELSFEYDEQTRALSVQFKVTITNSGDVVEDIVSFDELATNTNTETETVEVQIGTHIRGL